MGLRPKESLFTDPWPGPGALRRCRLACHRTPAPRQAATSFPLSGCNPCRGVFSWPAQDRAPHHPWADVQVHHRERLPLCTLRTLLSRASAPARGCAAPPPRLPQGTRIQRRLQQLNKQICLSQHFKLVLLEDLLLSLVQLLVHLVKALLTRRRGTDKVRRNSLLVDRSKNIVQA